MPMPFSPVLTAHTVIPTPFPSTPTFHIHLTRLTDTLFIWVGTSSPSSTTSSTGFTEPLYGNGEGERQGVDSQVVDKRLAVDWAVAMPAYGSIPETSTPLFRPSTGDVALAMARRLARRFPNNQIHVSLSLPAQLTASSGPDFNPTSSKSLLIMEKKLSSWLDTLLSNQEEKSHREQST